MRRAAVPTASPTTDRRAIVRRATALAVTSVLVPPAAWTAALGASYVGQDFTCSAAASAGAPVPDGPLGTFLLVLNVVLFAVVLVAGALGVLVLGVPRAATTTAQRFLATIGVAAAVLFALGIVLIGATPLVLDTCG